MLSQYLESFVKLVEVILLWWWVFSTIDVWLAFWPVHLKLKVDKQAKLIYQGLQSDVEFIDGLSNDFGEVIVRKHGMFDKLMNSH